MKTCLGNPVRTLFVLDTGAPWNRSLLHALPPRISIHGFRVQNAFLFSAGLRGHVQKFARTEHISNSWNDTWCFIPGWNKAYELSSWLVRRRVQGVTRRYGNPDAILFTLPWYAMVAESFPEATKAYYAHDTFRFYGWDRERIIALERRLLRACSIGFAVAKHVRNDLQELAQTPIHYLPMATGWLPGTVPSEGESAAETDLRTVPRPRIGCIGQIHSNPYDCELIEHLSASFRHAHFVFVGPRFEETSIAGANRMEALFSRPNVHWLGPKPHSHLPAYLRRFDVCFNPLRVSEANHRRSPLRLYDYLTTDKPILSTAICEAYEHQDFVAIGRDMQECERLLTRMLAAEYPLNLGARHRYLLRNTWSERARTLIERLCGTADRVPCIADAAA